MRRFQYILSRWQGKSKTMLHQLYSLDVSDDADSDVPAEFANMFAYEDYYFYFEGTGFRNTEKLFLYVVIPTFTEAVTEENRVLYENFLLGEIAPVIKGLNEEYFNQNKSSREKGHFEAQDVGECILRRSGMRYSKEWDRFVLQIHFDMPLVNALSINAKAGVRAVKDILRHVRDGVNAIDEKKLEEYVLVYKRQQEIRKFLRDNGLCCFVANGSILPRQNGTQTPLQNALPFVSPKEMEVTISFEDGTALTGMGIPRGVTVITGGGYSGKSTLLDAIELGIYNHIPGDGREYVITDADALKVYAEDGRPVHNLDMTPFFKMLPGSTGVECFSTGHASGSVSQAANIIEAVCGGCKLLLIDEDKSATNFMIRDKNMRAVVKKDPIIPFTDRVRELYEVYGVSSILVIGGSSEYLAYADKVVLMEDFEASDITDKVEGLQLCRSQCEEEAAKMTMERRLMPRRTNQPFLYFQTVETENERKIILDEYSADITLLTALTTGRQMNLLANIMEGLLTDMEADSEDVMQKIKGILDKVLAGGKWKGNSVLPDTKRLFYEEIRPLDAFCGLSRMRGVTLCGTNKDGNEA